MIVFKTFYKVIKKSKGLIFLFTGMLLLFGIMNATTEDIASTFTVVKPNILIVNNDNDNIITNNLVNYLKSKTNIIDIEDNEEKRNDALFYRDVSYIIYIPKNYGENILKEDINLDIKSSKDYEASLAEMILKEYLKVQKVFINQNNTKEEIINNINSALKDNTKVEITSTINIDKSSKIGRYFNFQSYTISAIILFIVCLVISSFHEKTISKRINISSMPPEKHNTLILLSSLLYAFITWLLLALLSIILFNKELLTIKGSIYLFNSLIFTICILSLALLLSNLIKNRNAISGVVNVLSLGPAFLCGAFIPLEYLPENVKIISHIFPAYYFTNTNDLLIEMELINYESLKGVINNTLILISFTLLFIILNNIVTKKR